MESTRSVDSSDHWSEINPFSDIGKETQNLFLDTRIRIWIFPKKRTLRENPNPDSCLHRIHSTKNKFVLIILCFVQNVFTALSWQKSIFGFFVSLWAKYPCDLRSMIQFWIFPKKINAPLHSVKIIILNFEYGSITGALIKWMPLNVNSLR